MAMFKDNSSPNSEKNWTRSRNKRIKKLTGANIDKKKATAQAAKTKAQASMLSAKQQPQLQEMQNKGRSNVQQLRNEGRTGTQLLRNKGQTNIQQMRNQGQTEVQQLRNQGRTSAQELQNEGAMQRMTKGNEFQREKDYRTLGGKMLLKGAEPTGAMQNLYNEPGWTGGPNVSDLPEMPKEKQEGFRFVKTKEPAPTEKYPNAEKNVLYRVNRMTGEAERLNMAQPGGQNIGPEMTGQGGEGGGNRLMTSSDQAGEQGLNEADMVDYQAAKQMLGDNIDKNTPLTPEQEKTIKSLKKNKPKVYQMLLQEYAGK